MQAYEQVTFVFFGLLQVHRQVIMSGEDSSSEIEFKRQHVLAENWQTIDIIHINTIQ